MLIVKAVDLGTVDNTSPMEWYRNYYGTDYELCKAGAACGVRGAVFLWNGLEMYSDSQRQIYSSNSRKCRNPSLCDLGAGNIAVKQYAGNRYGSIYLYCAGHPGCRFKHLCESDDQAGK